MWGIALNPDYASLRSNHREKAGGRRGLRPKPENLNLNPMRGAPFAGGIAEELAAGLQAGAPSFFREDDKTFFRAAGLLQRAAECGAPADRDSLASEALKLLLRVPLAADLGQVVPQLLALHQAAGVIELALQVCAAPLPLSCESGARRTLDPEHSTYIFEGTPVCMCPW